MNRPLITCIMPTANRREFVPRALELFARQDYPSKELIVVDDGTDEVHDLMPTGAEGLHIQYMHLGRPGHSVGEKRNIACREARGEFVAHWDDDDWYASRRLSVQIDAMQLFDGDLCGASTGVHYRLSSDEAWGFSMPARPWLCGATLLYRKALWQRVLFSEVSDGEDTSFVDQAVALHAKVLPIQDPSWFVAIVHDRNTIPRRQIGNGEFWHRFDAATVRGWMDKEVA